MFGQHFVGDMIDLSARGENSRCESRIRHFLNGKVQLATEHITYPEQKGKKKDGHFRTIKIFKYLYQKIIWKLLKLQHGEPVQSF